MKPQIIITTCIDVETIISCAGSGHVGSHDNPLDLSTLHDPATGADCQKTCIYMLTKQEDGIISGKEYRELSIHATIGDIVELYNIILTNELDYEIDAYNLQEIGGQGIQPVNAKNFWLIIINGKSLAYKCTWFLKIKSKRNPNTQPYYVCWKFSITLVE